MDEDYVVVDRAESSVVTTPDHQVVTVVTVEPTVITDEMLSYVTTISTDTQVVAAGQQGPAGRDGSDGAGAFTIEAGEDLLAGTPVKVVANKVYAANQATDPLVVGLVQTNVLATFSATLITSGPFMLSGLTPATPYFVGAGIITTTCPSSGYVIRIGSAVSSTTLLVTIEEPILLS